MRLQAIQNLYPQVVTTDKNETEAFDKDGNLIALDESLIGAEITRLKGLPPPKAEQLSKLIVTISTGKRFYAGAESRTDLLSAIFEAHNQGATDASVSNWKTPDGIISVNLAELKEASKKALEAKAGIIGVN